MKKQIIIGIICVILAVFGTCFAEETSDFRSYTWGTSRDAILKKEGKPALNETGYIAYEFKLDSKSCVLIYYFKNNELHSAGYLLTEEHVNQNLFLNDYNDWVALLIKKYGESDDKIVKWESDLYKDDKQEWGKAVSVGDLSIWHRWELPRTTIISTINGDNLEINVGVMYYDKAFQDVDSDKEDLNNI